MFVLKHRNGMLNYKVKTIHPAPYRLETTAQYFAAASITRTIAENVVETAVTNLAPPVVFARKKYHSLLMRVD